MESFVHARKWSFPLTKVFKQPKGLNLSENLHKFSFSGIREMSEKNQMKLKEKIYNAYGSSWKDEEIDSKTNAIKDSVQICCQNADLVSLGYVCL